MEVVLASPWITYQILEDRELGDRVADLWGEICKAWVFQFVEEKIESDTAEIHKIMTVDKVKVG